MQEINNSKKQAFSSLDALKTALENNPARADHFYRTYKDKPITLLRTYHPEIKWPAKFRQIFAEIWTGRAGKKIIITGPRGGGKSVIMGALGFCLWYLRRRSIADIGGSLSQAKIVYGYFSMIVFSIKAALDWCKKEPLMEHTESITGKYFKALAASPKAVRGPHPDALLLDEVCEATDDIIADALPMVTSSPNPLTILTSTFHKVFGAFQEIWDNADELGYTRFSWDIFDVTLSFDPSIWNDPELRKKIPDLDKLKALSDGRCGDPEGWVLIENIIDAWQGKRSLEWFLTEFMGTRPSAAGLVNDPIDVEAAVYDHETVREFDFVQGAEVIGGLDWGFSSMTSWAPFMNHKDGVKVMVENRNYTQVESEVIITEVIADVKRFGIKRIYADSAGKFENAALKRRLDTEYREKKMAHRCEVIEVVFSKDKEEMLGNYRAHFQRRKVKIPAKFLEAKSQHKRYRYVPGTDKPAKKDDHIPDATMCALKHWPLGVTERKLSDLPDTRKEVHTPISQGLMKKRF